MKTWNLPNNTEVTLGDGEVVKFLRMDGMYGKWEQRGKMVIGNFDNIELKDGKYYVT